MLITKWQGKFRTVLLEDTSRLSTAPTKLTMPQGNKYNRDVIQKMQVTSRGKVYPASETPTRHSPDSQATRHQRQDSLASSGQQRASHGQPGRQPVRSGPPSGKQHSHADRLLLEHRQPMTCSRESGKIGDETRIASGILPLFGPGRFETQLGRDRSRISRSERVSQRG